MRKYEKWLQDVVRHGNWKLLYNTSVLYNISE